MRRTTGPEASRQPPRWRVGVLDSDSRSRGELSRLIEARGGLVVVDSPPRPDSVDLLRRMEPDAVVLGADDVMDHRGVVTGPPALDLSAAVVLLASAVRARTLRGARAPGVMGVLLRPLRPEEVGPTLDIAVARFRELRRLRRALADRPVVEEAKARLMAREGLSEPAAFGWLRRRAMERRVRIGDVARRVLGGA
ncbi:MAG: ANTAR domain-containing response regulator [Candidatus Rokuibacteriota bacterium]